MLGVRVSEYEEDRLPGNQKKKKKKGSEKNDHHSILRVYFIKKLLGNTHSLLIPMQTSLPYSHWVRSVLSDTILPCPNLENKSWPCFT